MPKKKEKKFANQSERQFAEILDSWGLTYQYEPRSFTLKSDTNGNVLEAFCPDFYIPLFDIYLELTTLRQPLVTRKNRKVRLLRQLHPEINVRIIYKKEFQELLERHGKNGGR